MSSAEADPTDSLADALSRHLASTAPEGVVAVYLFGSVAGERQHRESDVDVGVVVDRGTYPDARDRFELRVSLTSELIDVLDRNDVDLVILNDAPPELGRRVVTEGRPVYVGNPDANRDFVRDIQLRAADLDPFLRRMRRIRLEALRS